jgi:hypothetical protein
MSVRIARSRIALLCALFALLACAVSWPLVLHPETLLGRVTAPGEPIDVGDGIAFAGYVARASRALGETNGSSVWQVAIANPNFTAPPAYLFPAAALARTSGSPLLAHNALMLAYVFLAFACMFAFVRQLTASTPAALYASLFYGSCNYVVHHLSGGHANQTQIFLFPLIFGLTEGVLERPGWQRALPLGAALALCAHSSSQYAVFLSLLLPLYVVIRAPARLREPDGLRALALAGACALVLTSYYLAIKLGSGTIERSLWENQQYVVHHVAEYFDPDGYAHLGVVPLLLAGAGLGAASEQRRRVFALGAVLVFSLAMTLGPMSGLHPYRWLYETIPVFKLMRTPVRFVAPAQMALFALAGIGLASLTARFEADRRARIAVVTAAFAASLVATPLLADRYFDRRLEPGHIWTIEVRAQPDYQKLTR